MSETELTPQSALLIVKQAYNILSRLDDFDDDVYPDECTYMEHVDAAIINLNQARRVLGEDLN